MHTQSSVYKKETENCKTTATVEEIENGFLVVVREEYFDSEGRWGKTEEKKYFSKTNPFVKSIPVWEQMEEDDD